MSGDAAAAAIAAAQHGVLTRSQAHHVGITDAAIETRLAAGRWHRAARGVYVIAGSVATFEQQVMVACCASSQAVASDSTAGSLAGLALLPVDRPIEVTVRSSQSGRRPGVVVHRRSDLFDDECTVLRAIPVTTVARTILDLAGSVHRPRLERIVDDAIDRRLVTWNELAELIARHGGPGRRGVGTLRAVLSQRGDGMEVTESELERRFVRFCRTRGLPIPILQMPFAWRDRMVGRADAAFPARRVLVELDGRRHQTQQSTSEADKVRDQEAAAAGWLTIRVTWRQLAFGADALEVRLRAILQTP